MCRAVQHRDANSKPDNGQAGVVWSVILLADHSMATSVSLAAILCPRDYVLYDPRGTGDKQLTTTENTTLIMTLPKGTLLQNMDTEGTVRMVLLLIPPFSTRAVHLIAPEKPGETCGPHRTREVPLTAFAGSIKWHRETVVRRAMTLFLPPSNQMQGPREPNWWTRPWATLHPYNRSSGGDSRAPVAKTSPA